MKAAITEGKGDVKIKEVSIPEINDYQCLCKTLACATCTGTDLKIIDGKMFWCKNYPVILGHESVGVVIKKGKKVRYIKEGEIFLRTTCVYPGEKIDLYWSAIGGFSEYGKITDIKAMKEDNKEKEINHYTVYQQKIPEELNISPFDATIFITLKETASFLLNIGCKFENSLLILGSGPVGMSLVYFSKLIGCFPVIVAGRNSKTLEHIKKIGADFIINTENEKIEKVKEITNGKGVDFIIDTTGNTEFVLSVINLLSENGKIAPYASYSEPSPFKKYEKTGKFILKGPSEPITHNYILKLTEMNILKPSLFYSHILPFEEIEYGFQLIRKKEAFKIVFKMEV
ncbi:MAG TPA: zinc-binding dehydrogenase [bacterium]|nr:zinc-binding dehydrogenase [bacterium]HOM26200.1 zinc-binding dehydrogenase [bacterium]